MHPVTVRACLRTYVVPPYIEVDVETDIAGVNIGIKGFGKYVTPCKVGAGDAS